MRRSLLAGTACIAAVMILLRFSGHAAAEELSFVPTVVTTEGDLGISASLQTSKYTQGSKQSDSSATFLSERLSLGANGYVYHPRFEVFLLRLSPALNQWDISDPVRGTGASRSSESTLDYEFRTTFLPEHPYNLELFALHQESASPQNFWKGQRGDVNTEGAIFSYKSYPFFFHMSYNDSTIDSAANRTETVVYRANATLRGDIMHQTASYAHTDTSAAFLTQTTQDEYAYFNTLTYSDLRLYSRVTDRTSDQTTFPDRGFQVDSFMWSEQLTTPLPWNFSADVSYWYLDESDRTTTLLEPAGTEEFNRSTSTMFHLTHHLYQSLVTDLLLNHMDITSSQGDITNDGWNLSTAYTKLIPTGRLLINGQYGETVSERSGVVTIINELHSTQLLGNFVLNSLNVAPSTISLQVKDPVTGVWLNLPASNYLVTPIGRNVQITVLNVAPATPQANPLFAYEFSASYSLLNASKFDMTTWGYGTDIDVIRDLLAAYYTFSRSEQDVVFGSFAGGGDVLVSNVLGLKAHRGNLSGNVERQVVRSRLTPWEAWRAQAQYRNAVAEDVNASVRLSTDRYDYLPTVSSTGYRAVTNGLDLGMDFRFPAVNTSLFLTSAYYATRSIVDSDTTSFNAYATWSKGLLSVNGGIQGSIVETSYATGRTSIYSNYVYLNVNRKLF